ncbi:MAG: endonuclease MutS2 [Thermodesulfovibrionales bacterium]|nr:endonuclease MutS2 [Thermodesulfovibrionales bacterium]
MLKIESLQALEFDKILSAISEFSNSEASRRSVLNLLPLNEKEEIEKRFGQIEEIRRLFQDGNPLKLSPFPDISQLIARIRPEGAVLESGELLAFMQVMQVMSDISWQLNERKDLVLLCELTTGLTGFHDILHKLKKSINSDGLLFDNASPELARLRSGIRALEARIRKRLEEIVRDKNITPFLQDDFITKRAERWVVPVRMDSKGQIHGVVHDVSRSGETAFMEPLEIIGITNELENLIAEEKTEVIRILRDLCQRIRDVISDLEAQFQALVYLDALHSIARFSDLLNMNIPAISNLSVIKLFNARHPILMLLHKDGAIKNIVPLDITLGNENSVMVITGPNAGGKTIAIKTVGLLMVMALSGIPIPADSSSVLPFVNDLLVDIGDEQSIENNLSTFSAHVSNISAILKRADERAVVLMDELGTGTEPQQGAAIACSVLKSLQDRGSLVFATTHLTDIVGFVYKTEGMINASMEFDVETLTPLFRLRTGEPGQSHALEIAGRYGLPEHIIDFAKSLIGNLQIELHNLISELREKRNIYEDAFSDIQRQKTEMEKKEMLLNSGMIDAANRKKEILESAYREAQDIILNTKKQMHDFLEEIKREKRRETLKKLEEAQRQIEQSLRESKKEAHISVDEVKEGDVIFVGSIRCDAEVLKVDRKHNRLKVMAGNMELEIPVSDASTKKGSIEPAAVYCMTNESEKNISSVFNIIGLRVDEALSRLERFLNHASMAGLEEVVIIHGIGTGALLKAVSDYLNGHPLVKQFRRGKQNEGGSGVTVAIIQ